MSLAEVIKQISVDATNTDNPDVVMFGKIIDCSFYETKEIPDKPPIEVFVKRPLTIQISDKFVLKEGDPFLVMLNGIKLKTESSDKPLYFRKGDTVAVIRISKGNKYLLLDVI